MAIILLLLVVYSAIVFYSAKEFTSVAQDKGYWDNKYFWICLFLGFPGWLLVIALPDRAANQQAEPDELPEI